MNHTPGKPGRRILFAAAMAALLSHSVEADLVAHVTWRAAVADKSDQMLIAANPILERLARVNPAALEEILALLRAPIPQSSQERSFKEGGEQSQEDPGSVFVENPDLAEYFRDSPEASLDLLRLIREAVAAAEAQ